MIMKRIDPDDDQPSRPDTKPAVPQSVVAARSFIPGLLYLGVPQDHRRLQVRIDSVRTAGARIAGPYWLGAQRTHSEIGLTELHFG
jgi:hypothetical protein